MCCWQLTSLSEKYSVVKFVATLHYFSPCTACKRVCPYTELVFDRGALFRAGA